MKLLFGQSKKIKYQGFPVVALFRKSQTKSGCPETTVSLWKWDRSWWSVTCRQVGLGLVRSVGEGGMMREPGAVLGGEASGRRRGGPCREGSGRFRGRSRSFAINPSLPAMPPGSLSPGSGDLVRE